MSVRYRGDTITYDLCVRDRSTGAARNLSGETVTLMLSLPQSTTPVLTKPFTITDEANGLATVELTAEETAALQGDYQVVVVLKTAAGRTYTVASTGLRLLPRPQAALG